MANLYSKVRELVSGLNDKDNSQLYQVMFDTAAAGMVTINSSGCIQACNPALCRIFGYDAEELIGEPIETLMPEAYARHHQAQIEGYLTSGEASVMGRGREVVGMRKNGEEFSLHLSVSEMSFAGSRCFTGVVHDLSESQQQVTGRMLEHAWLGNVLDHTPAAVMVKDMEGRYLLLNRRAERLFSTRADAAVGKTDVELFDSQWASMETRTNHEIISSGRPRVFIQPIVLNERSRILLVSKNLLKDAHKAPIGVVSLCIDISSLPALKQLEQSSELEFLNLLPQALALVSADGDILRANQAYAERFGMGASAICNCSIKMMESDAVLTAFSKLMASSMQEIRVPEGSGTLRLTQYRLDGKEVVLLTSETGDVNISAPPTESSSLRPMRSLTDNAQFIASLSHELRTPLNSVIGFSQILKSGSLQDDQLEAVGMIERAGKHLVALVDQMLDLIKLEGAVTQVQSDTFALLPVVEECIELASPLEQHKIQIRFHSALVNPWVSGDRTRVKQIILNLLTNAIKYSGEVKADVKKVDVEVSAHDQHKVRICVKDQGLGIAEHRQQKIFVPFERLGAEHSAIEGSGLGLAICRQLAERMEGEMNFISEEGKGSSFWLDLPAAQSLYASRSIKNYQRPGDVTLDSACRVLYIEDNFINARFVELGLKSCDNVDVTIAHTGQEGMDKALEHAPDVILLDMRLPDIHGLELLKKLRDIPELRNARIYGVSADALPGHINAAEDAGLDGYMTKPLDLKELNNLICH